MNQTSSERGEWSESKSFYAAIGISWVFDVRNSFYQVFRECEGEMAWQECDSGFIAVNHAAMDQFELECINPIRTDRRNISYFSLQSYQSLAFNIVRK